MPRDAGLVESGWHVYILRCRDEAYYVGLTSDLARRCDEHFTGRGGHYTKSNPPARLLYSESFAIRADAEKRERQFKGWTRRKKAALIAGDMELLKRL